MIFSVPPCASYESFPGPKNYVTWQAPVTGSKSFAASAEDNTAYESMSNGDFASIGAAAMRSMSKSRTITRNEGGKIMRKQKMKPIHPGEVLLEDYLKPLRMSQNALAKAIGVQADRISEIVRARRGITGDSAVRLAHYFDTTPDLWLGLQADYDIELAKDRLGAQLKKMPQMRRSAA